MGLALTAPSPSVSSRAWHITTQPPSGDAVSRMTGPTVPMGSLAARERWTVASLASPASPASGRTLSVEAAVGGAVGGFGIGNGRGSGTQAANRAAGTPAQSSHIALVVTERPGTLALSDKPRCSARPAMLGAMKRSLLLVPLFSLGLFACGSKDSISVSASVSNVQLAVADKALGTELSGSFDLYVEVGPEADGSATISPDGPFSLVREQSTVVDSLSTVPQGVTFPIVVGKGASKTIVFQLDTAKLLPAADKTGICAGPVRLVGAVKHNLNGGETKPLTSPDVSVTGC